MVIEFSLFIGILLIFVAILTPLSKMIHKDLMKDYLNNGFTKAPDVLVNGEYEKLIIGENDFFYVVNGEGEMIYMQNSELTPKLTADDIGLIPYDYNKPLTNMDDYIEFDSENYIYLDLDYYKNLVNVSNDYYILDNELNILETNIKTDKKFFTEKELKLIQGDFLEQWFVSKLDFTDKDGKALTCVFFREYNLKSRIGSDKRGYEIIKNILLVMLFLMATPIYLFTLYKNIKEPLNRLDDAIKDLSNDKDVELIEYIGPMEFQSVYSDFNEMAIRLSESKKETQKAEENNRKIIAYISHDLKTPLTVIQGYNSAFLDDKVEEDNKLEYHNKINDKVLVMSKMISELNEYSRLNHPDFNIKTEESDILKFFREYFEKKIKEIKFFGHDEKVNIPEGILISKFDPYNMTKVLDNIINNTLQHTKKGTGVIFDVKIEGDKLVINIGDDGQGIPKKHFDNIFKPFTTFDEARREGGGIGMAIVMNIINHHGGKIKIREDMDDAFIYEITFNL